MEAEAQAAVQAMKQQRRQIAREAYGPLGQKFMKYQELFPTRRRPLRGTLQQLMDQHGSTMINPS